jgi:hypothetical protein
VRYDLRFGSSGQRLEYYYAAREKMFTVIGRRTMSKGMDRKKETKKKPAKSPQEKRAAKKEKKQNRGFQF